MLGADRVRELLGAAVDGDVIRLDSVTSVTVDDFLTVAGFGQLPANATIQDMLAFDGGVKGYAEFLEQFLEPAQ